jgi:hypothetical protein
LIKLTDLAGRSFWVKASAVTLVREPYGDEFMNANCRAVIYVGAQFHGVLENMAQVTGALGMT